VINGGVCRNYGCENVRTVKECTRVSAAAFSTNKVPTLLHTRTTPKGCIYHRCPVHEKLFFNKGSPVLRDVQDASFKWKVVCMCPKSLQAQAAIRSTPFKMRSGAAEMAMRQIASKHAKAAEKESRLKVKAAAAARAKQYIEKVNEDEARWKSSKTDQQRKSQGLDAAKEAEWKYKHSKVVSNAASAKRTRRATIEVYVKEHDERAAKRGGKAPSGVVFCGLDEAGTKNIFAASCPKCPSGYQWWCSGDCTYSAYFGCHEVGLPYSQLPANMTAAMVKSLAGEKKQKKVANRNKEIASKEVSEKKKLSKKEKLVKEKTKLSIVKWPKSTMGRFCGNGADGNTPTYSSTCKACPAGYKNWCVGECVLQKDGTCDLRGSLKKAA